MSPTTSHFVGADSSPVSRWWAILLIPLAILCVPDLALAREGENIPLVVALILGIMFGGAVISCLMRQVILKVVTKEPFAFRIKRLLSYAIMEVFALCLGFFIVLQLYDNWLFKPFQGSILHPSNNRFLEWNAPILWIAFILVFEMQCFVPNLFFRVRPGEEWNRVWSKSNVLWALGFGLIFPLLALVGFLVTTVLSQQ